MKTKLQMFIPLFAALSATNTSGGPIDFTALNGANSDPRIPIERGSGFLGIRESLSLDLGVVAPVAIPSEPSKLTFDWEIASLRIDEEQPTEFAVMEVWLASESYDLPEYNKLLLDLSGSRLLFSASGGAPGTVRSGSTEIDLTPFAGSEQKLAFGLYVGNEDYHDALAMFRNAQITPVPEPRVKGMLMIFGLAALLFRKRKSITAP